MNPFHLRDEGALAILSKYSMRSVFLLITLCFTAAVGSILISTPVRAATLTVCASGCDYTTANAALAAATTGDIVEVQGGAASPYSSSTEVWPITFPSVSSTLTCTGGASIGQTSAVSSNLIYLSTSSTVTGCTFGNVSLRSVSVGSNAVAGVRITNNTFSSTVTSTIELVYGARNFEISGNTNINFLSLSATSTNGLIQSNTFYGRMGNIDSVAMFVSSASSSQLRIFSNTFTSYLAVSGISATKAVSLGGYDQIFATNTITFAVTAPSGFDTGLLVSASGTNYIAGNFIDAPSEVGSCYGISIAQPSDNPWISVNNVTRNTIRLSGNCWNGRGVYLTDTGFSTAPSSTLNATYNIIFNAVTTTISQFGIEVRRSSVGIPFTQTNSYNGAYRMGGVVRYATTGGSTTDVSDATSLTSNPFLKVSDASSSNDLQTADFSPYLDVNGTADIGATSASRRSSIYLDDSGTIDYAGSSGVDATSTGDIASFLRTGDTVYLAAGSYRAFSVNSSNATSSITIQGVGASTVVNAQTDENAITLTNVSSSVITALLVQNASSTSNTYTATRINFAYGGNDYSDSAAPLGIASNSTLYFTNAAGCIVGSYDSDGTDLTSYLGSGSIHFGLIDMGGFRLTILVPNSVAANSSALQSILTDSCGMGTVDQFISGVFTLSSGVYTYQASAVSGASATLVAGVTSPPTITRNTNSYAGIKLAGTTNHITVSSVTSTQNGYGVWFATTSNGYNTVSETEFSTNSQYDINSASNATNTFDNSSFTRTSSTITGTGPVVVKFNVRGQALRAGNSATISSVTITATDAASAANALGSTGASGYTSFTSLLAYKLTSASSALTNGGFNPYTLSSSATGYAASSTSVNIASRNQTASLYLTSTVPPTVPSGATFSALGSTTATVAWTDASDDETAFIVDYINLSAGESFPGTTSNASADATSTNLTGLSPNTTYQVRIQATSTNGGIGYSTSSAFTTYAAVPDAPTVSAVSQTSVSVVINPNGNSTSTTFAIYSSTLGGYLNGSGVAGSSPTWQTTSTWGTLTVSNLSCNTTYSFSVIARNLDLVLTATSTAGSIATSACSSSGSGSSSGGGATSAGSGSGSLAMFTYTSPLATNPVSSSPVSSNTPVTVSPTTPPSALVLTPAIENIAPGSPQVQTLLTSDARGFGVNLSTTAKERLAGFIERGTSEETRELGSGERRALVRDLLDTMRRSDISTEDLERLASGQIPLARNLAQERTQLPRVRQTFRTLYGHDPNFQNSEENLAWNTLMYRIRFPRDLAAEREGIQQFRNTFRRSPSDPFQWAVVRVLGYVQE